MSRNRKRPKGAPTHVRSVALRLTPAQRRLVDTRFHAGVRVYNACLREALDRGERMRADPAFALARAMAPGVARTAAFHAVRDTHGFTSFALRTYASSLRCSWVRGQALSQEVQVLGARAFDAVNRWHCAAGGRPRFKSTRRGLKSLAAKDLRGSLRPALGPQGALLGLTWGAGTVLAAEQITCTGRRGREARAERAERAGIEAVVSAGEVLSCRIVKTVIRSRATYRAQLVCAGHSPQRHPVGTGVVSLDLGPSTVAVVTTGTEGTLTGAALTPLAAKLADTSPELRRAQRHADRQHRAGSPACFDYRGRHTSGRCEWRKRSTRSTRTAAKVVELHRRRAAYRATSHGALVNTWLAVGPYLRTEKLNYVAWQKNYPRSVRDRAPGLLIEMARRKAASAGGGLYEYSTWTTALSQTCVCGVQVRKELCLRTHRCGCGVVAQRDLFSAFLGLFVRPEPDVEDPAKMIDLLDVGQAYASWPAAHDMEWLPASETTVARPKRRGQVRPSGRSVARIKKRRLPPLPTSDGVVRQEPVYLGPTAVAA